MLPYPRNVGSVYVSGKLSTNPSPKPTLTLTSHLGQNVGLGEGQVGSYGHLIIKSLRAPPEDGTSA